MNPCGSSSAPLRSSAALILFWWPHHENRDALSTLLYACYSLHLSPPHEQTTHTPTGWETGDAYPSADPTGNADTGLPICCCSLRQDGWKAGEGGEERRGEERRGEERRGEERERKLGDRERRREHFDNPEICPDACGWPYSNCFPNRWFVLDRHILLGLQTCSFSSAFSICQPINPLGFNHRAAKGNLHNYSWKIPQTCCMSVLTWSSSQSSLCRHTAAC